MTSNAEEGTMSETTPDRQPIGTVTTTQDITYGLGDTLPQGTYGIDHMSPWGPVTIEVTNCLGHGFIINKKYVAEQVFFGGSWPPAPAATAAPPAQSPETKVMTKNERLIRQYRADMSAAALYNRLANDLKGQLATEVDAGSMEILEGEIDRYRGLAREMAESAAQIRSWITAERI